MKKMDNDTKERIRVAMLFLLEAYKVLMGTFLCVTVPHSCEKDEDCSMMDTFRSIRGYGMLTVSVNAATFFAICFLYVIELMRENFMIQFFDIDSSFSDLHLKDVITPPIQRKLLAWNELYWKAAATSTSLVTANIALSCVYLGQNYQGTSTLTSVLSFSILVLMKLWRSFNMARKDHHAVRARSAYMTEYTSFNVLDKDVPAHMLVTEATASEVSADEVALEV